MKKIISMAMALVMMMAVMVPAFAAELTEDTVQSADATVQTDISGVAGDGTYTVTYPATMALTWGTESTAFNVVVTSQLKTGKCVSVVIADKAADGFVMKNADGAELAYALTGSTTIKTTNPVVTDDTYIFNVDVTADAWAAAAFDEYSDVLTVTSAVADL